MIGPFRMTMPFVRDRVTSLDPTSKLPPAVAVSTTPLAIKRRRPLIYHYCVYSVGGCFLAGERPLSDHQLRLSAHMRRSSGDWTTNVIETRYSPDSHSQRLGNDRILKSRAGGQRRGAEFVFVSFRGWTRFDPPIPLLSIRAKGFVRLVWDHI